MKDKIKPAPKDGARVDPAERILKNPSSPQQAQLQNGAWQATGYFQLQSNDAGYSGKVLDLFIEKIQY